MKKILTIAGLIFAALLIWLGIWYLAIAFVQVETNPFTWSKHHRLLVLFAVFVFAAFTPVLVYIISEELEQEERKHDAKSWKPVNYPSPIPRDNDTHDLSSTDDGKPSPF